ncbi:Haloacid dehalogenase domain protein hydrolase [Alteracholeplasma palmae J233]|uniref:Haloacid dehalogenase domain protein hydrolase n=1 Tax=Alteracholeplasma palmae (strain ATCC 49389 / J233) TaxID=1318466 RepID=U4KLH7_ALTPJ|nr:HAD hydrolase-like protein [Alteracholeplasma palmae]CCV64799.1 Haloacid dehalogenase domain protein hydrolase [Alteracholeplasma palmae J233]
MIVFWDFNGTILDDLDLCHQILNEMLVKHGKKEVTKERYLDIFTFPIKEYYELAGFDFNEVSFETLALEFIEKYQEASLSLKIHENLIETVKYFKEKGYTNVVLSASQLDNLLEQMKHYKIDHLFDDILGITDVYAASKVQVGQDYIKKNNLEKEDKIMIGDTLHDAQVALSMGCNVILYTKGHQAKSRFSGYETIDNYKELIK